MNKIYINKIIPLSTVDGKGARVAIFTQGCNIHCLYCHNPETIQMDAQSLSMCTYYSSQQLVDAIKPFFVYTRGITVSGGECMLHPEFLHELFTLVKNNNKTCLIDTNGTIDCSLYPALMAVTDGVLLDIKAWDTTVFKKLTGATKNDSLINNLVYLSENNKLEEVRIVCLQPFVDVTACIDGIVQTIPTHFHSIPLKLIAFRNHGVLGELSTASSPSNEEMQQYANYAKHKGFSNVIVR